MVQFKEMSEAVPFAEQLGAESAGTVVLVNVFTVAPEEAPQLLRAWAEDAAFMKKRPGFVSTQLHEGIAGSGAYFNYAVWESAAAFRAAFSDPEFQERIKAYPPGAVASPHLFRKKAVAGICPGAEESPAQESPAR